MYIDSQETFSTAQSVAAAVGDIVSTNVYDTGSPADVGIGEQMFVYAHMVAALAGVGSSIQVVLQTSADNSTWVDAASAAPVATAAAVANATLARFALPIGLRRYLRLAYRISGATTTAGTASGYLVKDLQANVPNASGVSAV
jgi:hypothetical protein